MNGKKPKNLNAEGVKKERAASSPEKKLEYPKGNLEGPDGQLPKTTKKPSYKHGSSDGGPGKWQKAHTPEKGAEYQQKVTGAPQHTEYVVDAPHTKSGKINLMAMIQIEMS